MASFRRRPYVVTLAFVGAAILMALIVRIASAGQARVDAETTGATQLSPAELEKKYEEVSQLLVTTDYRPRSFSDRDNKYEEAKQFLDMTPVVSSTPYVEGHAHPKSDALKEPDLYSKKILQAMERAHAVGLVIFSSPFGPDERVPYDDDMIARVVNGHGEMLAWLGGGGSLNPMMLDAVRLNNTGSETQRKVREVAEKILRNGASGFGEITLEHLAVGATQTYDHMPPDNPLMLLLADIAAEHGVPILIHMEVIPQKMSIPADLKRPPNPLELQDNLTAFKRLLTHNPRTKILWAHAGLDNTGYRTPELMGRLLKAYPNLYMDIKIVPARLAKNPPFSADGTVKPDWLKLFQDFPDRFMVGSDQSYSPDPGAMTAPGSLRTSVLLVNQLPKDLERKIGRENAFRFYSFGQAK